MKWYLLDAMLAQIRRKPLVEAWLAPRVIAELDHRRDSLAAYLDQPRVRQRKKHVIELSERSTKGGTGPTAIECSLIVAGISVTIS